MDNQNPTQAPPPAPLVSSTPTTPTQASPPPKKSFPKLFIALIIIFIVFVGSATTYVAFFNKVKPAPVEKAEPTKTPTPTPDPTADWKTYTSATFGYSLKYPTTLTFSTSNYQGIGGSVNTDTWTNQSKLYSINVYSYKSGVNSKLEFNLQPQQTTTIQLVNQTINKIVSVDETLIHIGPIKNGNEEYMIVYSSGTQKNTEGAPLFNQILSTFKFTES